MGTYQSLKKALPIYKDDPTLFTKKEFAIWVNYFHYLEEQCFGGEHLEQIKVDGVF
jgi:hypothetical protein